MVVLKEKRAKLVRRQGKTTALLETSEVSRSASQAKNCGVLTIHSSISNHYMPISFDLLPMLNFTSCLLCIAFDTCFSLVSSSVHSKHQFIFFRIAWFH